MRRILLLILACGCLGLPGCTMYDMAFGLFGSHYSGGGTNAFDRQQDFNEAARSYGADQ